METDPQALPKGALSAAKLEVFFIKNLNRIYCAKAHLQIRLPEIRTYAHFTDLTHAITETLVDVEKQISRMDRIFYLWDVEPDATDCQGMVGLIEDAFTAISQEQADPEMCDLAVLFYLQNIESVEIASFKMLNLLIPEIDKKEIRQLLKENFDDASDDLALLRLITSRYIKKQ